MILAVSFTARKADGDNTARRIATIDSAVADATIGIFWYTYRGLKATAKFSHHYAMKEAFS